MKKSEIKNLKKRHGKETRFRIFGMLAIAFSLAFLVALFAMILSKSNSAFLQTKIALEIDLSPTAIYSQVDEVDSTESNPNYRRLIKQALRQKFPDAASLVEISSLYQMISKVASVELEEMVAKNPDLLGKKNIFWLSASSKIDVFFKHREEGNLSEKQLNWAKKLGADSQIKTAFNWNFFRFADSREPEIAGIGAGLIGSLLVMAIFLGLAFPIGVMCAFYLEEFAPKNRITDIIEISINNLAAIPSIIYGLLGLTVYLQFFYLPRSSALVGGMTLFMLVLPVIIIATRNTIRSIPASIRDAAMALGASKVQIVLHHLLPLSIPGIMTGTILAVSRALGETAPLLMIGMVAFIADIPQNFVDPTTVLPVQIYLWSDSPEVGFSEKTAAAILVLLGFLILFNLVAIILRKKFERKW
jgi:phosphate transport system permease protein